MILLDEEKRLYRPVPAHDWQRETFSANGAQTETVHARIQRSPSAKDDPWEMIIDKVVDMQRLGDDWDGLGAKAPARELLASAVGLAYLLKDRGTEPPKTVVLSLSGTVVFEWQWADGEVEVDRPLHADAMLTIPGQPPKHWELPDA